MRRLPLLALALATASALVACGHGDDVGMEVLTAEPEASVPAEVDLPTIAVEPTPTVTTSPTPAPTDTASRLPGDRDRGVFVRGYDPDDARDLEVVAADVVVDEASEVVAVFVRDGAAHLEVAWWDGRAYEVGTSLDGGAATDIIDLRIRDVNADGLVEIVVSHRGEDGRAGITVWQVAGIRQVNGLIAIGGCNAGRSTYGAVGAVLQDRNGDDAQEIYATCDDAPLPRSQWSTDRYVWADGSYRHLPEVVPTIEPAPTGDPSSTETGADG